MLFNIYVKMSSEHFHLVQSNYTYDSLTIQIFHFQSKHTYTAYYTPVITNSPFRDSFVTFHTLQSCIILLLFLLRNILFYIPHSRSVYKGMYCFRLKLFNVKFHWISTFCDLPFWPFSWWYVYERIIWF